jgi:hypothetical protein
MQVDSIRSRLGSESELDGVAGCTGVESSRPAAGILDWSPLKYARRRWDRLEKTNPSCESSPPASTDRARSSERGSQTHLDLEFQEFLLRQGKVHLVWRIRPDKHSVEDQERRSYLHRSERAERT